ncbi:MULTISPECIES: mannonate dehydratase [Haloferax]|uniref:mannonate dehydratase n=1 Tax=Haloferax massiliensis TaxID=1476858 RepID=A0A0D6JV73_9EURY|nr:mannonate dehydratase [Haloferax massiliensis]MDS0241787.1 mannonate dehydratase [Haloferax sp. S2CR25]MDS0444908.1 mannonate dehydratase [Haloferax sp. S2CR25-2]CQR52711.1 Mannonate dehydratase [Haloferax massiliensis]
MNPAVMLPPSPDRRWTLTKQLGVESAVVRFWGVDEWWEYETLLETRNRFADHGFSLDVVEDRPPMERTVLGQEGRDEEIETVKRLLRNMGRLGINVYCWVWTENPVGVIRTSDSIPDRGDSLVTGYDHEWLERAEDHPAAGITEEELWDNLQYFLDEVVPVAEEAGVKMALHPDDPPVEELRGVPRIVTSLERYERVLELHESPNHGVTFCQGNFAAMGEDVPSAIRRLGEKIHFVHFRDVEGTPESFVETWHDDGPTDMAAAMEAYQDIGFDGAIRPDHVPKMLGEEDRAEAHAGYTDMGRLFAIGYMKGLIERGR